ncbi:DUF4238 domain-containing protein [Leptospira mtsangambouensis]|uniref:DUF4238 domain-containing protein n=1 Tax=Leptospira mtsangambouensis TaxID=2484912 RepID=A0ABY2NZK2_9LEPT|nr:DUF4238 domain-containing protein [Leptospira mtsangambouensis]TGM74377.1 DUF4238 domain-containing protein [Leptospira mtsangambouensis]
MGQNQHTVPQVYLSNFTDQNSQYPTKPLRIFDKNSQSYFARGTSKFLASNHFYSYTINSEAKDNSIEKYLSFLESKFAGALNRLISHIVANSEISSKLDISLDDKKIFAQFLLWQIKRTVSFMQSIEDGLAKEFELDGLPVHRLPDGGLTPELRNYALYVLTEVGEDQNMNFLNKLLEKNLIITIIPESVTSGFITSDNPVLITNAKEKPGISLEHTEISLTLTPKIGLSFFKTGKSIVKNIQRNKHEIRKTNRSIALNAHQYVIGPSEAQLRRICKNL